MRTITSRGLISFKVSQPRPHFSSVPGWKFSTITSAFSASSLRMRAPSGVRMSSVIDFLLRHSESQGSESPLSVIVPKRRSGSPTWGSSTFNTSAPNSASWVEQKGPARKLETSRTRMSSSGWRASSFSMKVLVG